MTVEALFTDTLTKWAALLTNALIWGGRGEGGGGTRVLGNMGILVCAAVKGMAFRLV